MRIIVTHEEGFSGFALQRIMMMAMQAIVNSPLFFETTHGEGGVFYRGGGEVDHAVAARHEYLAFA
jgi:hypothetical protein